MPKLLTDFQEQALKEIGESELSRHFVWSGGTCLSSQYLYHRESHDLDFLSKDLLPDKYVLSNIKKIAKNLKVKEIEEQKRFNRHQFWFKRGRENLKIEFVYYPFSDIKKPKELKKFNVKIESIEDILTNKAHAILERTEPKDTFDFYCITEKEKIKLPMIFKWVKKKFGTEIDPVLFIGRFLEGAERLNEIKPLVFKKELYQPDKIKKYFRKETQNYLKNKIK